MAGSNLKDTLLDNGRYRVGDRIAHRGPCEWYEGEQTVLERKVIVKIVHPNSMGRADLVERFVREAKVLAKLDHPGLTHILDVGMHDVLPYLVRDYVKGKSLYEEMQSGRSFTEDETKHIMASLLDAIGYAHEAGIVHRDLQPLNIILDGDNVTVSDFQVLHLLSPENTSGPRLTAPGAILGSPKYSAPEQLMGIDADPRVDLYSIGVLAFEMMSGQLPYPATTPAELLALMSKPPPDLREVSVMSCSAHLSSVVGKLIRINKEERYASAQEALAALETQVPSRRSYPVRTSRAPEPVGTETIREAPSIPPEAIGDPVEDASDSADTAANDIPASVPGRPRSAYAIVAAAVVLVLLGSMGLWRMVSSDDTKTEDVVAATSLDESESAPAKPVPPDAQAAVYEARRLVKEGRSTSAMPIYARLAPVHPDAFQDEDVTAIIEFLESPDRRTKGAQTLLMKLGQRAVPSLQKAFADESKNRFLRRRVGEVLIDLGEQVDMVPIWLDTLESSNCGARRMAVQKLEELGDPRAVPGLEKLAERGNCGGPEAKEALERVQMTSGRKSGDESDRAG